MSVPPRYFHEADLPVLAREAYEGADLTHTELAKRLDVHRVTITRALGEKPDRPYTALLIRIIEECSGQQVEGPFYRGVGDTP